MQHPGWSDVAPWYEALLRSGKGPHPFATDATPEMLDAARAHEAAEPLGIRYVLADARGLDGLARRVGNHHRSVATYLTALIGAGFVLEDVEEARATGTFAAEQPVYTEVPMLLAVRATTTRG